MKNFLWGVASSAFQVEGSPEDSDWYRWTHDSSRIKDHTNADRATDFWNRFDEDFQLTAQLGANAYRLSIAWERIEPERGKYNDAALRRYQQMIEVMRARGLEPVITLHHFVLPAWLAREGGLLSTSFVESFVRYGKKVIEALTTSACNVRYWMTFNEPNVLVRMSYLSGEWPPGEKNKMQNAMRALAQMAEAHIALTNSVRELPLQWGIAHHVRPFEAKAEKFLERISAKAIDWIFNRQFVDSLSGKIFFWAPGAWPVRKKIPALHPLDYLGLNYYGRLVTRAKWKPPFFAIEEGSSSERSDLGWEIFPDALYSLLRRLYELYRLPILISENGIADRNDRQRSKFLDDHLSAVMRARKDGIPILGYLHWSLTDNFEWSEGLSPRFGLVEIDYENSLARKPRASYFHYQEIIKNCAPTRDPELSIE